MESAPAIWREDLDAMQFAAGNGGNCLVHRLAFRALHQSAVDQRSCIEFFDLHQGAFKMAAEDRIEAGALLEGRNFHLNSRQIRRCLESFDWPSSCMTILG